MKDNTWARLLAYVTGLVNQELLLRNEYLAAENRILRAHLPARLRLTDPERSTLAEIGKRLGRSASAQATFRCPVAYLGSWSCSPRGFSNSHDEPHLLRSQTLVPVQRTTSSACGDAFLIDRIAVEKREIRSDELPTPGHAMLRPRPYRVDDIISDHSGR